jgi:hypothetical protein
MAGQQRMEILDVTSEPYVCCGGMFPCGPLGEPQDRSCVVAEACCCPGLTVSGNRFLIQTRFDRQNTACDDCLLWATCLAPYLACLCECAGVDVPQEIDNCVDCMHSVVVGCMLAQQKVELDHIKAVGFTGVNPAVMAALPPMQQQMVGQGKPHMGTAVGMAAGAALGGAAGAAAMYSARQPRRTVMAATPTPHVMGYPVQEAAAAPAVPAGPKGGFLNTTTPNGLLWWHYCHGRPFSMDPVAGHLQGPWGECLAWAKVFEFTNPSWHQDPAYAMEGPCGQVIEALTNEVPFHMRSAATEAAERLEGACEQAAASGMPLPVIHHRV